jgi:hypothetical protein
MADQEPDWHFLDAIYSRLKRVDHPLYDDLKIHRRDQRPASRRFS